MNPSPRPKEGKVATFEIQGWGHLEVAAEGVWHCGTAVGSAFHMLGHAGGTMDVSEMKRLINFLRRAVKRIEKERPV